MRSRPIFSRCADKDHLLSACFFPIAHPNICTCTQILSILACLGLDLLNDEYSNFHSRHFELGCNFSSRRLRNRELGLNVHPPQGSYTINGKVCIDSCTTFQPIRNHYRPTRAPIGFRLLFAATVSPKHGSGIGPCAMASTPTFVKRT